MPSAGISASSSRDRNADLWIQNARVTPLREADVWIRHLARALRQSQDADLWIRHLARRERVPRPKVDAKVCLLNHHFDTADLRKSIDEAEKQQSHRRVEANETVEVDLRVNTAKVHVEQQEALLRQTSSNPWSLFNQDVLALKDVKGNKIYGDARARVVAWRDMPVRLRALLGDVGPAKWLQHPFSGYSVHFFCVLLSLQNAGQLFDGVQEGTPVHS